MNAAWLLQNVSKIFTLNLSSLLAPLPFHWYIIRPVSSMYTSVESNLLLSHAICNITSTIHEFILLPVGSKCFEF